MVMDEWKLPREWELSILTPIYNTVRVLSGDKAARRCTVNFYGMQFGVMPGKEMTDAIFVMW